MKTLFIALAIILVSGIAYGADFFIEKMSIPAIEQPQEEQAYAIKYTTNVKDVAGNTVTIIEEARTEYLTVKQLESQKTSYQNAINAIDAKLAEIEKIK